MTNPYVETVREALAQFKSLWLYGTLVEESIKALNYIEDRLAEKDALIAKYEWSIQQIAGQQLMAEMEDQDREDADFEGGYDTIIEIAREALSAIAKHREEKHE
jgi:hypothetical protein